MILSSHQPNFLPYMGFFYKMANCDVFVLSGDNQYSSKGLHNKNFIKIGGRKFPITVPVKYEYPSRIDDVQICYQNDWRNELLKTLSINYKKAPYFDEVFPFVASTLKVEMNSSGKECLKLSELNETFIRAISEKFGLRCKILLGRDLGLAEHRMERIIEMCHKLGADTYYSGIGGKAYNQDEKYVENGISLIYSDYEPIRYKQLGDGFIENLSVLDYVFCNGFNIPKEWLQACGQ